MSLGLFIATLVLYHVVVSPLYFYFFNLMSMFWHLASKNLSDWWLSFWVSNVQSGSSNTTSSVTLYYLKIYTAIGVGNSVGYFHNFIRRLFHTVFKYYLHFLKFLLNIFQFLN